MSGRAFGLFLCFLSNRRLRVVLEGKSSQKYPVNAGVPQYFIFVPTLFLLYITTFLMMVSVIFLSMLVILHSTLSDRWKQLELASELESNLLCNVWSGATCCYLDMLDKLEKWMCRTVGPSLATSFEPLAYHRYVSYFGSCSSELAELVPLLNSRGRFTCYSNRLHDFSVTIPICY